MEHRLHRLNRLSPIYLCLSVKSVLSVFYFSAKKTEKPYKFRNFIVSNCIYSIDIQ